MAHRLAQAEMKQELGLVKAVLRATQQVPCMWPARQQQHEALAVV